VGVGRVAHAVGWELRGLVRVVKLVKTLKYILKHPAGAAFLLTFFSRSPVRAFSIGKSKSPKANVKRLLNTYI